MGRNLEKETKLRNILIVEDNWDYHFLLDKTLKKSGYKTVNTFNGLEGINILKENPEFFDLVLLDIMMPVMSGGDFLREFEKIEDTKRPYVCVLTSILDDALLKEFEGAPVIGYFPKDYDLQSLVINIETVCSRKKTIRQLASVYNINEVLTDFEIIKENDHEIHLVSNMDIPSNSIIKLRRRDSSFLFRVETVRMVNGKASIQGRRLHD